MRKIGDTYDLILEDYTEQSHIVRTDTKKAQAKKKAASVYNELLEAGMRLMEVIEHNKGGANKDLQKFAERIQALCDKYDR